MNKTIIAIVSAIALLLPPAAKAQGTVQASNLGLTPITSAAAGSDYWIAQSFYFRTNDPNSYALNSVQLLMNPASGNPAGFSVSIYSNDMGGGPQNYLGSLTGSTDPSGGGIFTYTASDITILGGIPYYVVVTATTPVAQGAYVWSAANSVGNQNWVIGSFYYYSSDDGSTWAEHLRGDAFQMALYATPVPEPGGLGLLGLGGILLWKFGRRRLF